jgi:hypothetical protein
MEQHLVQIEYLFRKKKENFNEIYFDFINNK